MDTSKLDPESRLQMRIIALETAIEKLNKDKVRDDNVYLAQGDLEKMILALQDRVKILEEARQRQIAFNTEVSNRLTKSEKPIINKPIKFWPW